MAEEHSYEDFLEIHETQLLASAVPDILWKPLYEKLKTSDLDAGKSFQLIVEENENGENQTYSVNALNDLFASDQNNIWLVDHAWTFRLNSAREALQEVPGLKERLMESFGIKMEDLLDADGSDYIGSQNGDVNPKAHRTSESNNDDHDSDHSSAPSSVAELDGKIINALLDKLPQFMQTYTMKVRKNVIDEQDMPLWFVADEFGMRIPHSIEPNVRMIPFYYAFDHIAYSLLFLLNDVKSGEEIARNHIENLLFHSHKDWYNILRLPWEHTDLTDQSVSFTHKDDSYFLEGRLPDQISNLKLSPISDPNGMLDTIKIYATDDQLIKHLRAVSFEIVDDPYSADVVWSHRHWHDFTALAERNPNGLVNQFPFESSLTVKDLFAACVQSCSEFKDSFDSEKLEWTFPTFYPATFNLQEELPSFAAYFQQRQQRNLENSWIVKPYNLARGLDTFITKNIDYVLRLAETGPKLAQKYIENPVLFRRPDTGRLVKFDLRYIVFVRSLNPLDVHIYKDFWPRCAIHDYDLQNLDDTLAHLSVFNYTAKDKVLNIRSNEFIDCLQKLHPQIKWPEVQEKIDHVVREVLKIATHNKPPRAMAANSQSRGMYGFDLMLQWKDNEQKDVDVMFLEANFIPDCSRACEFYHDFADTVFQTLFLGGGSDRVRRI